MHQSVIPTEHHSSRIGGFSKFALGHHVVFLVSELAFEGSSTVVRQVTCMARCSVALRRSAWSGQNPRGAGLDVPVAEGLLRFSFVGVGHPRTEVELGYTFGILVINLALADLIPGT